MTQGRAREVSGCAVLEPGVAAGGDARRRWPRRLGFVLVVVASASPRCSCSWPRARPDRRTFCRDEPPRRASCTPTVRRTTPSYGIKLAPASEQVRLNPKQPSEAACCSTCAPAGCCGSERRRRVLPIASLTKMMTALVVVAHAKPDDRVLITREATRLHRLRCRPASRGQACSARDPALRADAAVGQRRRDRARAACRWDAGSLHRDDERRGPTRWALRCTHFTTVSGHRRPGQPLVRRPTSRCIAHAVLQSRLLARIVALAQRDPPVPDQGRQAVPLQQQSAAA